MLDLRMRLGAVLSPDPHAEDGKYLIRSLYFDDLNDRALYEKLDGINYREKFRIRYYNGDTSHIRLEMKTKLNGLGNKQSALLTAEEARRIVCSDIDWMAEADRPLVRELYVQMKSGGLRPRTIVDYIREPYIYAPGNVRVTIDYNIRTGLDCVDFLNADCIMIPVPDDPILLEVKWDAYLPDIVRDIVQLKGRQSSAFSKYAACRSYR